MTQPVLHDFRCDHGHEFEAFTAWSKTLRGLLPRRCQCGAEARVVYKHAPAIRTTDNIPREQRLTTTSGWLAGDARQMPDGRIVSSQLGMPITSREDIAAVGKTAVSAHEFEERYLHDPMADAPPEGEFCDNPKNLADVLDDCDYVYDKAMAGELPPFERPMTEAFEKATGKTATDVAVGALSNADDGA